MCLWLGGRRRWWLMVVADDGGGDERDERGDDANKASSAFGFDGRSQIETADRDVDREAASGTATARARRLVHRIGIGAWIHLRRRSTYRAPLDGLLAGGMAARSSPAALNKDRMDRLDGGVVGEL